MAVDTISMTPIEKLHADILATVRRQVATTPYGRRLAELDAQALERLVVAIAGNVAVVAADAAGMYD